MRRLGADGKYTAPDGVMAKIREVFTGGAYSDKAAREIIADLWYGEGYLIDTHTAVAYGALQEKRRSEGQTTPTVVLSTASPYKFCGAVLSALEGADADAAGGVALIDALYAKTRVPVPKPLAGLDDRAVRFPGFVAADQMKDELRRALL
jgi:threonine synthase